MGLDSGSSCGRVGSYFFHSASLRKKNTGLFAPLGKARASPGPPWPVLSRSLRRRRPIINLLSDAALDPTRPWPPPGGSPPGSALHNTHYANLPLRQAPPRRAHARPTVQRPRQPAPRSWVPSSRLRGYRRSTWPPSRKALRAFRRFASNARLRTPTGCSGRTLGTGCLVLSSRPS